MVLVLIESDWNLKDTAKPNKWRLLSVLIESDWNLKYYNLFSFKKDTCINRIRLEFKERYGTINDRWSGQY